MTEKLYDAEPYGTEFISDVVEVRSCKDGIEVALEGTLFFPEEGGQCPDIGTLEGYDVLDVKIKDGVIWHKVSGEANLQPGMEISGKIDFAHRYDLMQQHSGEHILSGIIYKNFGYANVGFHLTEDIVTVDVGGPLTEDDILRMEQLANQVIHENVEIIARYPSKEELVTMNYRSKKELPGAIRIVTVGEYDCCACCAPHVARTGEVGLLYITSWENYKGGVRLEIKCGNRALKEMATVRSIVKQATRELSAKPGEIILGIERLKKENGELKVLAGNLQTKLLEKKAEGVNEADCIIQVEEGLDGNGARNYANLLLEKAKCLAAVLIPVEENGYRYIIASKTLELKEVQEQLKENFGAKGGGKSPMIQGTLYGDIEEIKNILRNV